MTNHRPTPIANPTIAQVLQRFLAERRNTLAPKTFRKYEQVIRLLQRCLDGYAYQSLDKAEAALFDRLYDLNGDDHREFCEIFGPDHILPHIDWFLSFFMIRKVAASKELLRAAGTVTKQLAAWLGKNELAPGADVQNAIESGAAAVRDLPNADELAHLLSRFAETQERGDEEDEMEDHFSITKVEHGRIWLEGMVEGCRPGPIEVPEEISRRCRVGWSISGVVVRTRGRWRLVETWNVYPE